ncbi:MAG: type III polyketide synthase [Sandaracinaceae bacterium]|nr:type III polyketide synthase [Sandaracinaceae bacterium]
MTTAAYINRIATSVPEHDIHEAFVRFARESLENPSDRAVFDRMANRAHIDHRYSVLRANEEPHATSLDDRGLYERGAFPSTAERMKLYERHAPELAATALEKLALGGEIAWVTHLIITSCTGFYAPGLDHAIVRQLGLRKSVERTIVGFMGCSAGVNALKLARHVVLSEPRSRVLIVNLELCTLHLQAAVDLETMLSFLLFSDGCAATLVTSDPVGLAMDSFYATTIQNTEDLITWHIGDAGFEMHLSGRVPNAIAGALDSEAFSILGGTPPSDIERWAVHPGGRSVLEGVERGLGLDALALATSRDVLQQYGNMSSATLSFVLDSVMLDASRGERGCALAFGPGLCAETMLFHKV